MDIFSILVPTLFVASGSYFVYRMVRHGGLRGAMFGTKVWRSVGEVSAESRSPLRMVLKLYILGREPSQKMVGLEFVAKSYASYQIIPATLSPREAIQLIALLQEAVRDQSDA
jgi:hypothetical protein